jgi:phage-related protein
MAIASASRHPLGHRAATGDRVGSYGLAMARMQAVYYRDAKGNQPVDDFIDGLPVRHQVTVDNAIDRLNDLRPGDPPLPFPWTSQIDGELRELRCHYGSTLYRVLYRRSQRLFVLLHAFAKSSKTVPAADIALAQKRWEDFRARMDAEPRTPPRAAGADAPK